MNPILVTPEEYATAAFILFQFGLFVTVRDIFRYPDEREK